jgi:hypothetical protein
VREIKFKSLSIKVFETAVRVNAAALVGSPIVGLIIEFAPLENEIYAAAAGFLQPYPALSVYLLNPLIGSPGPRVPAHAAES